MHLRAKHDDHPPNERGTELSTTEALVALDAQFQDMTVQAEVDLRDALQVTTHRDLKLTVRRLTTRRCMGTAVVHVSFTDGSSVRLDVALARVRELRDALTAVLGR